MEKPIIIKKVEFVQNIKDAVNNSGLPAFMMVETIQSLLMELRRLEEQEVQKAIDEFAHEKEGDTQDE